MENKPKGRQGFASMDPLKRAKISALGGKAVPPEKRAFSNRETAAAAGRKGGGKAAPETRTFHKDPAHAVACGRKGGAATKGRKRNADA